MAKSINVSPTYLSRLFKKETGQCLQDYINEERVYHVVNLLMQSDPSQTVSAEYVHFPSQSNFSKVFKQFWKVSPRVLWDQYHAKEAEKP